MKVIMISLWLIYPSGNDSMMSDRYGSIDECLKDVKVHLIMSRDAVAECRVAYGDLDQFSATGWMMIPTQEGQQWDFNRTYRHTYLGCRLDGIETVKFYKHADDFICRPATEAEKAENE